ncbi:MAG TPA: P1 family peptidase [Planctomycetota bacterium]|nr:P1 family peptidase [Planctomycetota bacterium]
MSRTQTALRARRSTRPLPRVLGIVIGDLPTGPTNSIVDVPGVRVSHVTLHDPRRGLCSGVTAIWPEQMKHFGDRLVAGVHVFNGTGKSIGLMQIAEHGTIETPLCLTSTLATFRTADTMVHYLREKKGWQFTSINPVVGECNDSYLGDPTGDCIRPEHVRRALDTVSRKVPAQGCVGAGTGTWGFDFKGGIGTASRVVPGGFTIAMLVQLNCGRKNRLTVHGRVVGPALPDLNDRVAIAKHYQKSHQPKRPGAQRLVIKHTRSAPRLERTTQGRAAGPAPRLGDPRTDHGSIMMVLATDAPLAPHYLARLARRVPIGLGRVGAVGGHGSGDIVIAFSTQVLHYDQEVATLKTIPPAKQDVLFEAAVDATEEAILNALFAATDTAGRDGRVGKALPTDAVRMLLGR